MRECDEVRERISLLLDGELGPDDEKAVLEHIEVCPECREMYEAFAALSEAMRDDAAEVPAALHARIMDGIRSAEVKKPARIIHIRRWVSAAACMVIVLGAALALGRGGRSFDTADLTSTSAGAESLNGAQRCYDSAVEDVAPTEQEPTNESADAGFCVYGSQSSDGMDDGLDRRVLYAGIISDNEERSIEEPDLLVGLLKEQPADAESDADITGDADCIVYLETAETEQVLKLYFRGEDVYVLTEEGRVYLAVGSAADFLELE